MTTTLRRIFPSYFACPNPKRECHCSDFRRGGNSREGDLEYRICSTCNYRYVVPAIAIEVLDPGSAVSRVVPA